MGRTWKLQCYETPDLQTAVYHNEKIADLLKVKTYLKRQVILTKYTNEDGTCETPPLYEDIHPECTLYQYGTLLNDNRLGEPDKQIKEYRRVYLESEEKGGRLLA